MINRDKGGAFSSLSGKSALNAVSMMVAKLLTLAFSFLLRTIFLKVLGEEYNGINALFTNMVSLLCVADLGIAGVLNYSLYGALKRNDGYNLGIIVSYYKRIYRIIALSIFILGILLIPFFPIIVKTAIPDNQIYIIYIFYLLNTVFSYVFAYRTAIISADQKLYVANRYMICCKISGSILQLLYLFIVREIYGYLLIQIVFTLLQNILLDRYVRRNYVLKEVAATDETASYLGEIRKNISATFVVKISSQIMNNSDTIVISSILGTAFAGYYTNYFLVIQYIMALIIDTMDNGLRASLGNLNAEDDSYQRSYQVFRIINLIYATAAIFCCDCLFNCMHPFVNIWIGNKYILGDDVLIAFILFFYVTTMVSPIVLYRETMGLFREVKYSTACMAVTNICLSVILGKTTGLSGIIFATSFSRIAIQFWYESSLLYKKRFEKGLLDYLLMQMQYIVQCVIVLILSHILCGLIPKEKIIFLFFRVIICGGITIMCACLMNWRKEEGKELRTRALSVMRYFYNKISGSRSKDYDM